MDNIKADVESNPENYEEVKKEDLPQEILDALNSDDYMQYILNTFQQILMMLKL